MADVFYKAGEIESWGRGFDKIIEVCEKEKAPCPDIDANSRGIMVLCKPCEQYNKLLKDRGRKEFCLMCNWKNCHKKSKIVWLRY